MNKQEIIAWLNNNFEKTYKEIENFLFSEINGDEFKNKETWHKHYFLEELKSPANGFPKKVLKIINDVQKKINNKSSAGRSLLANFVFGIVGIIVWQISAQIIGFILLVVTVLFTKDKDILQLVVVISQLTSLVIGIWIGSMASRWVKNYKKGIKK